MYTAYDRRLIFYKPEDLIVPSVKTFKYYSEREEGMDQEFCPESHPVYVLKNAYMLHINDCVTTGSIFCGMSVCLDEAQIK